MTALTSSWEGSGALLSNGDYYDWGYNAAGQLGNGSRADSAVPVQVALPAAVRQVFQGGSGAKNGQSVAILANGSVWAWGDNDRGQLGNGTRISSDVPLRVEVPKGVTFVKVSSGGYASYAIDRSGRLWAWGDNKSGQLGTGAPPPSPRNRSAWASASRRCRRPPRTWPASAGQLRAVVMAIPTTGTTRLGGGPPPRSSNDLARCATRAQSEAPP